MNQRLNEKLSKLPETLNAVAKPQDLTTAIAEVERLVLKANYEDKQAGTADEPYENRPYLVGEANTRGLSWKLNLFKAIADATFCSMVRVGVHGGNVLILGQGKNIDVALQVYEALVPAYDRLSGPAFSEFSDGRQAEEGAPSINRTGWINQWLISAPGELAEALSESRAKDASSNNKIAHMVAEAEEGLKGYRASLAPAKAVKEPKAPKAPKEKKSKKSTTAPQGNGEVTANGSESADDESTPDDSDDAYPEGDTAEEARAEAAD